jgi:hypothetical protein
MTATGVRSQRKSNALVTAAIGVHRFELWAAPQYGDFQILHYAGSHLIPLHRCASTETSGREAFERLVERYAERELRPEWPAAA